MKIWTDACYPIVIASGKGTMPWTVREIRELGYKIKDETSSKVVVEGSMRDVFKLNLHLRTAQRVLVPLLRARCLNIRELYSLAYSIDWENLLEIEGYFSVSGHVFTRSVRDTRLPSLVVKDAIADRMRDKFGRRPNSGPLNIGAAIYVYWEDDTVLIYLNTTGDPLSRRGYRRIPGTAPMQETLAASCIKAMGWDGKTPFISPMCGSGTPAIEAAMIASKKAPGSLRSHFAFMSLKGWNTNIQGEVAQRIAPRQRFGVSPEQIWKDLVLESKENEIKTGLPPIIATDISPEAIENAMVNAGEAGVENLIKFKACDFAETSVPELQKGVVFFNPEYGIRLGDPEELAKDYERIGDFMKNKCEGYTGAVLTGNAMLSHKVGLRTSARIPFWNGPVECRLLIYKLYSGGESS